MTEQCETIAVKSRAKSASRRQRARRQSDLAARRRAARSYQTLRGLGESPDCAAQRLGVPRRTLAHWEALDTCHALGRPCKESPSDIRLDVLEFIQDVGPLVGLPTLRLVFPNVPRGELIDLQRDYRRLYLDTYQLVRHQLTWHRVGAVWAMDHSDPPCLVDGIHPTLLAARDLASGMQLVWSPMRDQAAESTATALRELIDEYGAPLVLKTDNGSAFKSELFQQLLREHEIIWLPSPPYTPQYNGACEAGMGSMKVWTFQRAAGAMWTSDDLEAARSLANTLTCLPDGLQSTHDDLWRARTPLIGQEREQLRAEVVMQSRKVTQRLLRTVETITPKLEYYIYRQAIRDALVERGMLSITRRSITLPLSRKNLAKVS